MDIFAFQLQADAAESEGCLQQSSGAEADSLPSLSSMFGLAASWGKKIQADLHLGQLVDQVKKQSEEVTKAYSQDLSEFAQAVRVGATRGIDEISTRFNQMKTELEQELKGETEDTSVPQERSVSGTPAESTQEKAKRLLSKLGADLEDLLREAIVIEAPGSMSTEEQRSAARKIIYDRRMAQLATIQESADTYLTDPRISVVEIPGATDRAGSSAFDEFVSGYSLDDKQAEMAFLLSENPVVAQMHDTLVADKVSESEFWLRYFFRAWMVDQEEVRRKKLVEAAVAAAAEDEFSWDMDEEESAHPSPKPAAVHETPVEAPPAAEPTSASSTEPTEDQPATNKEVPVSGSSKAKEEAKGDGAADDAWDEWE
ncbi:BSD domain-containing protein 1 [Coemansia sp. BCRC 34301]|nr:BSD domain-containing protein 1 [Coemansia sp. BCRC 34301]